MIKNDVANKNVFDFTLRYPQTSNVILVISITISMIWGNDAYMNIAEPLLQGVQSSLVVILVKTALLLSYALFFISGMLLLKVKNIIVNFVGLFVMGLGFGIAIRLSLRFVGFII